MIKKDNITEKLKEEIKEAKHTRDELLRKKSLVSNLLAENQRSKDEIKISQIKRKISNWN